MIAARHVAVCKADTFTDAARPLFDVTMAAASGYTVEEASLPQVALSMAMQACVNAAGQAHPKMPGEQAVKAYAASYASWVAGVAATPAEAEDALIAFERSFRRAFVAIKTGRRA